MKYFWLSSYLEMLRWMMVTDSMEIGKYDVCTGIWVIGPHKLLSLCPSNTPGLVIENSTGTSVIQSNIP